MSLLPVLGNISPVPTWCLAQGLTGRFGSWLRLFFSQNWAVQAAFTFFTRVCCGLGCFLAPAERVMALPAVSLSCLFSGISVFNCFLYDPSLVSCLLEVARATGGAGCFCKHLNPSTLMVRLEASLLLTPASARGAQTGEYEHFTDGVKHG